MATIVHLVSLIVPIFSADVKCTLKIFIACVHVSPGQRYYVVSHL